ncbi:MAG: glucan biosynthesis protein [Planctomycetota bacterium]|nr:MAG: glucan biosynthesis protein [Planctomycetota bacterium]
MGRFSVSTIDSKQPTPQASPLVLEATLATDAVSAAPPIDRRHDLDALRAIAMLLGIVLHAALSFSPIPWTVKDRFQSDSYYVLFAAIHGFRMPLFFMLSGFFTAMLWRRRGLWAMLLHRARRIGLPLFLSCLTIIPAMWIVTALVSRPAPPSTESAAAWEAVVAGDTMQVLQAIEQGDFDVNAISEDGASVLTVAVFLGHTDMVKMLIDKGADVHQRNRDLGTALHSAAFLGRAEEAELLLRAGADPDTLDIKGQTPKDLLTIDFLTTNSIANAFGTSVDERRLWEGRQRIARQLGIPESSLRQPADASGGPLAALFGFLFYFPFFMHLWFLWFLCWLVAAFPLYAWLGGKLRPTRLLRWLTCSWASLLWLVPLTMLPQAFMTQQTFGPDASIGLLPLPHVMAYYAVFFYFGALYWDAGDAAGRLGRHWIITIVLALLIVFPVGLDLVSGTFGLVRPQDELPFGRLAASFLQALYAWLMLRGSIGLFRQTMPAESKTLRYISDSSYWLYLSHLPLVLLAQWLVRDWPMPTVAKFVGIVVVVTALLLLSYHYCVRYTWIGRLLNGPLRGIGFQPVNHFPSAPVA